MYKTMDNIKSTAQDAKSRMSPVTDTNDRRDFNRMPTQGNVLLRVKTPPGTIYDAHLVDVSASGVNIALKEAISVGTEIQLAVKIQDHNEHFFVTGVVARSTGTENGRANQEYPFQLGVELRYEKNNPDFHDWRALFIA